MQYPQRIMPVYNAVTFTVNSSNKSQCNFSYICDVYVNGTYVTRLRRLPKGTTGYGEFEVNRVLEDFVTYDLKPNLFGWEISTNSICSYELKFGEEYDNSASCDAGTTAYPNLLSSSSITNFQAINAAIQYKEWLDWDYTKYLAQYTYTAPTGNFMTDMPDNALVQYGDQMVWNILQIGFADIVRLLIKTYDSSNTLLGTYEIACGLASPAGYAAVFSVGVGPENLNNSTLYSGAQPVISSAVSYYTLQTIGTFLLPSSVMKTVELDNRESKYDPVRFWFLNRYGAFDSYTYSLKSDRDVSIERNEYKRLYGEYRVSSPTNEWTYDIGDRGRTVLNVNARQSHTVVSNWMTEAEGEWMESLFTTPEAYVIDTNVKLCASGITITEFNTELTGPDWGGILVGESVIITPREGLGPWVAEVISNDGPVLIVSSPSPDSAPMELPGEATVLRLGFMASLDPIVMTSKTYSEKLKRNIKNVNYTVSFDKAYDINIQRN